MQSITITRPDDWHVHLRDGDALPDTVRDISRYFGRALVMPNLVPPVIHTDLAREYRDNILSLVPEGSFFTPVMTLYLTDQTSVDDVVQAKQSGFIGAFKLYPAGATTNSDAGVNAISALYPIFEAMQEHDMPLAVHGEVTDHNTDVFDREAAFLDETLVDIVEKFPRLRVILEHITTEDAVRFVESASSSVAATITVHHLLYNRNHMLAGGIRPVYYCLPILKRGTHQEALIEAATSGNPKFFLGTDSAPHPRSAKENACGCAAGCYTAHAAIELYAEVFDAVGKLDKLEAFASHFGADFYQVPRNTDRITLTRKPWSVPETLSFGKTELIPVRGDEEIFWTVE